MKKLAQLTVDNPDLLPQLSFQTDSVTIVNPTRYSVLIRAGGRDFPSSVQSADMYVPPVSAVNYPAFTYDFALRLTEPSLPNPPSGMPESALVIFTKDEPLPSFGAMALATIAAQVTGTVDANITNSALNVTGTVETLIQNASIDVSVLGGSIDATIQNAILQVAGNVDATILNQSLDVEVQNALTISGTVDTVIQNAVLDVDVQGTVDVDIQNAIIPVSGSVDATIQNATLDVSGSTIDATIQNAVEVSGTVDTLIQNADLDVNVQGTVPVDIQNATIPVEGSIDATIQNASINSQVVNATMPKTPVEDLQGTLIATITTSGGTHVINLSSNTYRAFTIILENPGVFWELTVRNSTHSHNYMVTRPYRNHGRRMYTFNVTPGQNQINVITDVITSTRFRVYGHRVVTTQPEADITSWGATPTIPAPPVSVARGFYRATVGNHMPALRFLINLNSLHIGYNILQNAAVFADGITPNTTGTAAAWVALQQGTTVLAYIAEQWNTAGVRQPQFVTGPIHLPESPQSGTGYSIRGYTYNNAGQLVTIMVSALVASYSYY